MPLLRSPRRHEPVILIALGGNLPAPDGSPPEHTLARAAEALQHVAGMAQPRRSRLYRSAPIPVSDQPHYINAVIRLEGSVKAEALLAHLHRIEASFGRRRLALNDARTLDLDLLDLNGTVRIATPILPHPRLAGRAFVLLPLRDVAPGWVHPLTRQSIDALIADLPPQSIEALPTPW